MKLFDRPNGQRGVSKEKLGVAGAFAAVLGWALAKYLDLEVPEDVLLAVAALLLGLVDWRARNQRAKEDRPARPARLR